MIIDYLFNIYFIVEFLFTPRCHFSSVSRLLYRCGVWSWVTSELLMHIPTPLVEGIFYTKRCYLLYAIIIYSYWLSLVVANLRVFFKGFFKGFYLFSLILNYSQAVWNPFSSLPSLLLKHKTLELVRQQK